MMDEWDLELMRQNNIASKADYAHTLPIIFFIMFRINLSNPQAIEVLQRETNRALPNSNKLYLFELGNRKFNFQINKLKQP